MAGHFPENEKQGQERLDALQQIDDSFLTAEELQDKRRESRWNLRNEAIAAIKAVFDAATYTVHDAPATIKILGELRDLADAYAQSLSEGMEVYDQ